VLVRPDGNNLMMQRKVTKGRDALCGKLADIKKGRVVVVFDGKPGEEAKSTEHEGGMRVVVTAGGDAESGASRVTADEWILSDMRSADSSRIEVVTADKELRRMASGVRTTVKLINPVKWCARPRAHARTRPAPGDRAAPAPPTARPLLHRPRGPCSTDRAAPGPPRGV
jgi:hypothetical protein